MIWPFRFVPRASGRIQQQSKPQTLATNAYATQTNHMGRSLGLFYLRAIARVVVVALPNFYPAHPCRRSLRQKLLFQRVRGVV